MKTSTFLGSLTVLVLIALVAAPCQATLVHHYGMNEGSGTTVGDAVTVNPQSGAFGPDMSGTTSWVPGIQGSAVVFDGSGPAVGYFVDFGNDPSFNLLNEGTIMAWVKPTSADTEGRLWQDGSDVGGTCCTYITVYVAGNTIVHEFPGPNPNVNAWSAPATGVWTHVSASWSVSNNRMDWYINGVQDNSISSFVPLTDDLNGPFAIGGDRGANWQRIFDGAMDEVKVFDNYMTASEVNTERFNFVPEPSTAILLALGAVALRFRRRSGS